MPKYLLTLDQGTTSSRALVIDHSGKVISVRPVAGRLTGIPIAGIAGDQQAALFGQMCSKPGMVPAFVGLGAPN